ncbi:MAG: hypothetical protein H5T86_10365, partial [Armatimonadetes bacterium]|nr:hypothetical protein [Armatimonadota bacterium]
MGPLLHLHPMWPELLRLEDAMRRLATVDAVQATPGKPVPAEVTLIPPALELLPPPALSLAMPGRRQVAPLEGLPPDIEVSLEWRKQQIMRRWQHAVQVARARHQAQMAAVEISAWRDVQVAINNLRIQEAIGGPGAEEARKTREKIEQAVQGRITAEREKSEHELSEELARLARERDAAIAELEQEALSAAKERRIPSLPLPTAELDELARSAKLQWWMPEPVRDLGAEQRAALDELIQQYSDNLSAHAVAFRKTRERQLEGLRA